MLLIFKKREPRLENNNYRQFPCIYDYMEDNGDEYEEDYEVVYDPTLIKARQEFFDQLTSDQIANIEVVNEYTDDHEPCLDVHITFTTGDVLSTAIMWTSLAGAFQYWEDSVRAKRDIVGYFKSFGTPKAE